MARWLIVRLAYPFIQPCPAFANSNAMYSLNCIILLRFYAIGAKKLSCKLRCCAGLSINTFFRLPAVAFYGIFVASHYVHLHSNGHLWAAGAVVPGLHKQHYVQKALPVSITCYTLSGGGRMYNTCKLYCFQIA